MPRGSGRRPKPSALKKIEGNRGKRPISEKEPKPAAGVPTAPKLSKAASKQWGLLATQLIQMGVLTVADRPALAGLAISTADMLQLDLEIEKARSAKKKKELRRQRNDAMKIMKSFAVEFGMTPAARTKVATFTPTSPDAEKPESKPANAADKYFSGPSNAIQ